MIHKQKIKGKNAVKVTFILPKELDYGSISVVGDFNDWTPLVNRFIRRKNHTQSTSVTLKGGRQYRFRYLADGGHWINDDSAEAFEPSGFGSENCVLIT